MTKSIADPARARCGPIDRAEALGWELGPQAPKDDVKATYTDGILEIRTPVDGREAAATKIPITKG
jgi:hypothetical protein